MSFASIWRRASISLSENVQVISPFVGGAFGSSSAAKLLSGTRSSGGARTKASRETGLYANADVHRTRVSPLHVAESCAWGGKKRQTDGNDPRSHKKCFDIQRLDGRHDDFDAPAVCLPECGYAKQDCQNRLRDP